MNDRQPRADVGLVKKVSLMFARRVAHAAIRSHWTSVALLIRRDDIDAAREPVFIVAWQLGARSRIDQNGLWQVSGVNVIDERVEISFGSTRLQFVTPGVERQLLVVEDHLFRVHDPAYA